MFSALSSHFGIPVEQLRFSIPLFGSLPIAALLRRVRVPPNLCWVKHGLIFAIGFAMTLIAFGWSGLHLLYCSAMTYAIMSIVPRTYSHIVVFFATMIYISVSHIYRMVTSYGDISVNYSGSLMMCVFRCMSVAFNYHDGDPSLPEPPVKKIGDLSLRELPSPLSFLGFIFFFPSMLGGPLIDFKVYEDFTATKPVLLKYKIESIPSCSSAVIKKLFLVAVCYVGFEVSNRLLPIDFLISDSYLSMNLFFRLMLVWIAPVLFRSRYYFVWYLQDIGMMLSGYTFNGFNEEGDAKWDLAENTDMIEIELAKNMKSITTRWNVSVGYFLKQYVFFRILSWRKSGRKSTAYLMASITTFTTSAIWHGFYPGYYYFFLLGPMCIEIARLLKVYIKPLFMLPLPEDQNPGILAKFRRLLFVILRTFITVWHVSYCGAGFMLLSFENSRIVYGSLYYIGHISVIGSFCVLKLWDIAHKKKVVKKKTT